MKKNSKGPILLFLCAFFWGIGFSAQSSAMDHIEPYTFVFLRSAITCLVLCALLPLFKRLNIQDAPAEKGSTTRLFLVGTLCGTCLVLATILQQIGLVTTTTAKSGFITALYIVIVPILGIFLHRRPAPTIWICVLISIAGLYFLCMQDTLSVNVGDLFTFASAIIYAIHILLIDRFGTSLDSVKLNTIQFGVGALIAGVIAFLFETPTLENILACWQDIVFVGVCAGAIGYTLQIVGQKNTDPTLASLIMCLESVFAAIGGWIILGQTLSGREILGCALMLSSSVLAQLPIGKKTAD